MPPRESKPEDFPELLRRETVIERVELRSERLGFMAFHGGLLEKVTDVVAAEAAARSHASYYGLIQTADPLRHVSSKFVDPVHSEALATFLGHVDAVVTIHGYGRRTMRWSLLLGGQNRTLAAHLAGFLRTGLPDFDIVDDLATIPVELAGQHPDNPVNRPRNQGVQIELPPLARWNVEGWQWSDVAGAPRAPQTEALIAHLAEAAAAWIAVPGTPTA